MTTHTNESFASGAVGRGGGWGVGGLTVAHCQSKCCTICMNKFFCKTTSPHRRLIFEPQIIRPVTRWIWHPPPALLKDTRKLKNKTKGRIDGLADQKRNPECTESTWNTNAPHFERHSNVIELGGGGGGAHKVYFVTLSIKTDTSYSVDPAYSQFGIPKFSTLWIFLWYFIPQFSTD